MGAPTGTSRKLAPTGTSRKPAQLEHAIWERSISRLRLCSRLLAVALLALGARALVSGLTLAVGLTAAAIVVLLLASVLLAAHGRRLEPGRPDTSDAPLDAADNAGYAANAKPSAS